MTTPKIFNSVAGCLLCLSGILLVAGCGSSDNNRPHVFTQFDRLARPAVNEVLASVANNRHQVNDQDNPTDDAGQLKNDIISFMTGTAGRSAGVANTLAAVLIPDVMIADLSKSCWQPLAFGVVQRPRVALLLRRQRSSKKGARRKIAPSLGAMTLSTLLGR